MTHYNKHDRFTLFAAVNGEKTVLQTLVSAELKNHSNGAEAYLRDLKASLTAGKKHSSATLLHRKLKGPSVRKLHEI